MMTGARNLVVGVLMGSVVLLTPVAPVSAAPAAMPDAQQGGLVNVSVVALNGSPILSNNNVAVGVAAQLVAGVCPNLSVGNVAVLAAQANRTNVPQTATCNATSGPATVTITPA